MLDALGNIGDFLGGIGVVVTLLYLASQIRQNTRSLRASAHQSITSHIAELNRTIVEHEQVAAILEAFGHGSGHVLNLGHGVQPTVDPTRVAAFADAVRELSPRYH